MRSVLASLVAVWLSACGCAVSARTCRRVDAARAGRGDRRRNRPPRPTSRRRLDAAEDAAEPADGIVHVVQPGQTLWRIARAYDVPLDTLAEANGIADPSRVEVGTPIFVPGARATIEVAPYPAPPPSARSVPPIRPEPPADFLWPVDGGDVHAAVRRGRGGITRTRASTSAARAARTSSRRATASSRSAGPRRPATARWSSLDHGDGVQTLYAHAEKVLVEQGDAVRRGQPIALLGRTGNATTEHCHFELRLENRAVDPMPYLLGTTEAHR